MPHCSQCGTETKRDVSHCGDRLAVRDIAAKLGDCADAQLCDGHWRIVEATAELFASSGQIPTFVTGRLEPLAFWQAELQTVDRIGNSWKCVYRIEGREHPHEGESVPTEHHDEYTR